MKGWVDLGQNPVVLNTGPFDWESNALTNANSFLNKGKSAIAPLINGPEVLSSASDKAKLFPKNLSKNSNLNDLGIFLPVYPSKTNLKQHNISITPKMVKTVIVNLDSSNASGPECIKDESVEFWKIWNICALLLGTWDTTVVGTQGKVLICEAFRSFKNAL